MTITRRLFAKAMAAAPVAAEALAKMGAGKQMAYALTDEVPRPSTGAYPPSAANLVGGMDKSWIKSQIAELTTRLSSGLSDGEEERCRIHAMTRLDPDLAALRSFSASALVAMQTQRNRERLLKDRNHWVQKDIDEWMIRLAKAGQVA